eukprot:366350-Chlamydomonas_euryale.AAC.16
MRPADKRPVNCDVLRVAMFLRRWCLLRGRMRDGHRRRSRKEACRVRLSGKALGRWKRWEVGPVGCCTCGAYTSDCLQGSQPNGHESQWHIANGPRKQLLAK